jgi:putative peptidoglycan lipid II flippase
VKGLFVVPLLAYDILLKHIGANLSLIVGIIAGAAVYFAIIYFEGIDEVDSMIDAVKSKLKRNAENEQDINGRDSIKEELL